MTPTPIWPPNGRQVPAQSQLRSTNSLFSLGLGLAKSSARTDARTQLSRPEHLHLLASQQLAGHVENSNGHGSSNGDAMAMERQRKWLWK